MNNSLFPSCYIASFSNVLRTYECSIDDDLLFGLSCSFDFQYSITNFPLSGLVHTFSGLNFNTYLELASILQIKYDVIFTNRLNFYDVLAASLEKYKIVIVEVSIKEMLELYHDKSIEELLSNMDESNTNHTINVISLDEEYVYILDNFQYGVQKIKRNMFTRAIFPHQTAVITSRGRIHCFEASSLKEDLINRSMLLQSLHKTVSNFLFSSCEYSGMRALKSFKQNIACLLLESDEQYRERSIQMFHYFCISAAGGSFFRRNYLRFLKKASFYLVFSEKLEQAKLLYRTLHHQWKSLANNLLAIKEHTEESVQRYLDDIDQIVKNEEAAAMCLVELVHEASALDDQFQLMNKFSPSFSIHYYSQLFALMGLHYHFKTTNIWSDVLNDYKGQQGEVWLMDQAEKKLVWVTDDYLTSNIVMSKYFYFIIFRQERIRSAIK